MPKKQKIIITSFLLYSSLSLVFLAFLFFIPKPALAEMTMNFQVPIWTTSIPVGPNTIGTYIQKVYEYLVGSVGIIATVIMMYAGVLWITAAGNQTQITDAKAWLSAAMTGMVLALASYVILYWVNPDLLNFKPLAVTGIGAMPVCCAADGQKSATPTISDNKTTYSCTSGSPCATGESCVKQTGGSYKCDNPSSTGCCMIKLPSGAGYYRECYNNAEKGKCTAIKGFEDFLAGATCDASICNGGVKNSL